jgi:sugar phosphate isomerase/epimerase
MEVCVSAWSVQKKLFSGELTVCDFIRLCHQQGVKNVELLFCFWNEQNLIDDAVSLLEDLDMKVGAYSVGNDFVQKDKALRELEVDKVKFGIDIACRLNTKCLRVFSGNAKEDIDYETARGWIVDCFKEAAAYAEEKEIVMVLENHGLFAGKSSQVKELIEEVNSKSLRANTDVGNFILVDENPLEAVKALMDYVSFVHFKDFKKVSETEPGYRAVSGSKYQGAVLGKGQIPMKEIVDLLYENGYEGCLSIEYEGVGDPIAETIESIHYTKSIIR